MSGISDKTTLRQEFKKRRSQLLTNERKEQNSEIANNLFALLDSLNVSALLTYVSFDSEVDTLQIISAVFAANIPVAVPRCNPKTNTMQFFQIAGMQDLTYGFHKILEPAPHITKPFVSNSAAVCIVPGVAFDMCGMRIGYGGGYYDRFLASFKGRAVGLAFNCQVSKQALPKEHHDKNLDYLITAQGTIKF